MPLTQPPPRGTARRHGRRSLSGARVQCLPLLFEGHRPKLAVLREADRTLARRSNCLHGRAVGTVGSAKPSGRQIGLLAVRNESGGA